MNEVVTSEKPLHPLLWLWVPVVVFALQMIAEAVMSSEFIGHWYQENGPHETAEAVIMFIAMCLAGFLLTYKTVRQTPWLLGWVVVAFLSCVYVAGEEVSWGQHIFDWATPDYWHEVNDQGETNLHNTSSWFDQKPRLILLIGVVTGGLIIPALRRYKPHLVPQKFEIIYPPAQLGVIAFFALLIQILDDVDEALKDYVLFGRASEIEEMNMFYFVLLYLIVLRRRVRRGNGQAI